jgi:phosphate transport system ATP-binding protein
LILKKNYTIVIVTHNMQQAQRISDHVAFMYLGELIEFDTCNNIFNHPKSELTKNYVSGHFG